MLTIHVIHLKLSADNPASADDPASASTALHLQKTMISDLILATFQLYHECLSRNLLATALIQTANEEYFCLEQHVTMMNVTSVLLMMM